MRLHQDSSEISLGLFAGDLTNLAREAASAASFGASVFHFDVMDGVFVPQLTAGAGCLKGLANLGILDAHLMLQHPARHVADFVRAGATCLTVHAEAEDPDLALTVARQAAARRGQDLLAGFALMPGTSLEAVEPFLAMRPDIILVLSLDPRDGQPANIPHALERMKRIRRRLPEAVFAFDGGVSLDTVQQIAIAKPNLLVSGSGVLRADDPQTAFLEMNRTLKAARNDGAQQLEDNIHG